MDPTQKIGEVMSQQVRYRFEDEEIDLADSNMGSVQLRRLPVISREKRLVGTVSIGDIASCGDKAQTGHAMGISTSKRMPVQEGARP